MMPNAVVSMVTVFMFSLVWHYNDVFTTSVLSTNSQTVAIALTFLRDAVFRAQGPDAGNVALMQVRVQAGALISVAPILIIFIFSQRFFTQSVERTGIVG